MNIFAFAGTNAKQSINFALLTYAMSLFKNARSRPTRLSTNMPVYSIDLQQTHGIPQEASAFLDGIAKSDAVVCSLAEHNYNFTAAFKNMLDWSSRERRGVFADKHMFVLVAAPSEGGRSVLAIAQETFPKFAGKVSETFYLPNFDTNFTPGKGITNPIFDAELKEKIQRFEATVSQ